MRVNFSFYHAALCNFFAIFWQKLRRKNIFSYSWFFWARENFSFFHCVHTQCGNYAKIMNFKKFTLTHFGRNFVKAMLIFFRQINCLVISLAKMSLSRNFFQKTVITSHSVWYIHTLTKNFVKTTFFCNKYAKYLIWRNIFWWE